MSVLTYSRPDQAYRRSARLPILDGRRGAYRGAMTTYDTPHFATGNSDLRSETPRTRPASAAPYRTAGVATEAAAMRDGPTPDWQPGASKGVPKAAIGAVGAALVGGVALAIVLMAPSNKVTKPAQPGSVVAQAKAENDAAQKSVAATDAAVNELDRNAPAAGNAASQAVQAAQEASAAAAAQAAVPAPLQTAVPEAPPVADVPVAHAPRHGTTPRVAPQHTAPAAAKTDTSADTPAATPPADVQAPAMHQTPDTPTVTPSVPATAPATTPDTSAQAPAQ